MGAKHHEDRWAKLVSNWNPAISTWRKGYQKQGRLATRWQDDLHIYLQPDRSNRDNIDLTSDSKRDAMESDFVKQPAIPTTPITTTATTQQHTTNQQVRQRLRTKTRTTPKDDEEQDDEGTLLILT